MTGFPDWDAVPEMRSPVRTAVPFPDPAPEQTAAMWAKLDAERAAMRAAAAAEAAAAEEDEDKGVYKGYEAPVITRPAEEFDEPCSPLARLIKLAHASGWTIHTLAHAFSTSKGQPYKGGAKAGQSRGDRNTELQWVYLEKQGVGRLTLSYPIINGAVYGAHVSRRFNGNMYGDAEIKKILRGDD